MFTRSHLSFTLQPTGRSKVSTVTALGLAALLFLTGCGDTENVDRDSTTTPSSTTAPAPVISNESVVVTAAGTIVPGSAADWDLAAGPAAIAARVDELSNQDVGITVSGNTITIYVNGERPAWLKGLTDAADGTDLVVIVNEAKYGQQYLLSAAQEMLPQILPLGATSVRPAQDLSSLVVIGNIPEATRADMTAIAADLEYPVEITFAR